MQPVRERVFLGVMVAISFAAIGLAFRYPGPSQAVSAAAVVVFTGWLVYTNLLVRSIHTQTLRIQESFNAWVRERAEAEENPELPLVGPARIEALTDEIKVTLRVSNPGSRIALMTRIVSQTTCFNSSERSGSRGFRCTRMPASASARQRLWRCSREWCSPAA